MSEEGCYRLLQIVTVGRATIGRATDADGYVVVLGIEVETLPYSDEIEEGLFRKGACIAVVGDDISIGKDETPPFEYEEIQLVLSDAEGNSLARMLAAAALGVLEEEGKVGHELRAYLRTP